MTHLNLEKLAQFRISDFVVDVMFDREKGWVAFYTSGRPIFTMSVDALADAAVGCAQIVLHGLTSLILMQTAGSAEDDLSPREVN